MVAQPRRRRRHGLLARIPFDLSFAALLTAVVVPLLMLGGASEPGLLAAVLLVGLASALVVARAEPLTTTRASVVARYALFGVAIYETLQLVPLPAAVLRRLSPNAARTWASLDAFMQRGELSHPLSLDPTATAFAAVTAFTVAVYFNACVSFVRDAQGRERLLLALAIAIVAIDVIALLHPVLGATRLFGLYAPKQRVLTDRMPVAPLLNSNHAAALSAIAPPILVMYAARTDQLSARVLAGLGAAVSAATVLLTLSRAGTVIVLAELTAVAVYLAITERTRHARVRQSGVVALILVATVGIGLAIAYEPLRARFAYKSFPKTEIAWHALRVAAAFRLFGAGRGAFGAVSPQYEAPLRPLVGEHTADDVRFSHVESWPAQLLVDLGTPMAVVYVTALGVAFLYAVRGALRRPLSAAATIALVGLVLHDLVDYSMEFVGVSLAAATLFAVVTVSGQSERRTAPTTRFSLLPAIALPLVGVSTIVAIYGHQAEDEAARIAERWRAGALAANAATIRAAMNRHPADPYFPMALGVANFTTVDGGRFLARAVGLAPARAQGHYWLARWFVAAGMRAQGWAEFRAALAISPAYIAASVHDMVQFNASIEELSVVATSEQVLEIVRLELMRAKRTSDAEKIDDALTERYPPAVAARSRGIERLVAAGDREGARRAAILLISLAPTAYEGYLAAARLETDDRAAVTILREGVAKLGDDANLLTELVRRRSASEPMNALATDLEKLNRALVQREGSSVSYHAFLGDLELQRGHPSAALKHLLDAAAASPDGLSHLEQAALLADSLSLHHLATTSWRKLSFANPDNARYRVALDRAEAAARATPMLGLPAASK